MSQGQATSGRSLLIVIDGPAAAGKTTVAQHLAQRLGYIYLESGALYRAVAWQATADRVMIADADAVAVWCRQITVALQQTADGPVVLVNGKDVTPDLQGPALRGLASQLSAIPAVRERLLMIQREIGRSGGVVAEGRDMGTVVFPGADMKFYLDARLEVRGERRQRELEAQGVRVDLSTTLQEIRTRDERDITRPVAPLRRAPDAVVIDASDLVLEAVVEQILRLIDTRPIPGPGAPSGGDSVMFRFLAATIGTLGYWMLYAVCLGAGKLFFRLRIRGRQHIPPRGGVLIAANHLSYLDIPFLGCAIRRRVDFVGRDDLFRLPVLGWLYRLMGGIPIRRRGVSREWLTEAVRRLRAGRVIVIYPEGTRGPGGHRFLEPKPGIGMLITQAGAPVVPALIEGTDKALPRGAWWPRLAAVRVTFGPPVDFRTAAGHGRGGGSQDLYAQLGHEVMQRIAGLVTPNTLMAAQSDDPTSAARGGRLDMQQVTR